MNSELDKLTLKETALVSKLDNFLFENYIQLFKLKSRNIDHHHSQDIQCILFENPPESIKQTIKEYKSEFKIYTKNLNVTTLQFSLIQNLLESASLLRLLLGRKETFDIAIEVSLHILKVISSSKNNGLEHKCLLLEKLAKEIRGILSDAAELCWNQIKLVNEISSSSSSLADSIRLISLIKSTGSYSQLYIAHKYLQVRNIQFEESISSALSLESKTTKSAAALHLERLEKVIFISYREILLEICFAFKSIFGSSEDYATILRHYLIEKVNFLLHNLIISHFKDFSARDLFQIFSMINFLGENLGAFKSDFRSFLLLKIHQFYFDRFKNMKFESNEMLLREINDFRYLSCIPHFKETLLNILTEKEKDTEEQQKVTIQRIMTAVKGF